MPSFDLRHYITAPRETPTRGRLVVRISVPIPFTVGAMTEVSVGSALWGDVWHIVMWSGAGIAIVWTAVFLLRPFLDWWYRDVDHFAALLPTVHAIQEVFREGYGYPEAEDRQAELVTRLNHLDIHPSRLAPGADEVRPAFAALSGFMKDRNLEGRGSSSPPAQKSV